MSTILALDVGSSSVRAQRFDHRGPPLGDVFHPREDRADAYRSAREGQQRLYEVLRGED